MTVVAVVQARMSSRRLPGKVLADIEGEPMLGLLLARLQRAPCVDSIVVATSSDPSDDPIGAMAEDRGIPVHRGPLDDVLARFVGAVGDHDGAVVRITGDCPLVDPAVVCAVVRAFHERPGTAYASNVEPRTFPDGLDVEVFSGDALREADRLASDPSHREHVTAIMRARPGDFAAASVRCPQALGDLRWTVDDPGDLEFVRRVVRRLGTSRHTASMGEILGVVRRAPALTEDGARG